MRIRISSAKELSVVTLMVLTLLCPQIGHSAAKITIINNDGAGEGLNDLTPFTPVGGNTATTLGQARLLAFQHAANIWAGLINSTEEITIDAEFNPLFCSSTSAVLGSTNVPVWFANFMTIDNTLYVPALANSLAHSDLSTAYSDMIIQFNVNLGQPGCLTGHFWYLGLDGKPPTNYIDFVSVALHEIAHGLGFTTSTNTATGEKASDGVTEYDDGYMKCLEQHGAIPPLWPDMTDAQRAASAKGAPNLHWVGAKVQAGWPTIPLTAGTGPGTPVHVQMYAPSTYQSGSSVVHWNTTLIPDPMMEWAYIGANHIPDLEVCLFGDIGWDITGNLFMKDNTADNGSEINTYSPPWLSPDIWTNPNPTDASGTMVDPEYGNDTYVHVRVWNNSCYEGKGDLYVYWAKASTGLSWPSQWINYIPAPSAFPLPCPDGVKYGDKLQTAPMSISVPAHSSKVFHFLWTNADVPNPADFLCFTSSPLDNQHFCLLARIQTDNTPPYGMTFPEGTNICQNVTNNNNIVWRNITVVDLIKKKSSLPQPYVIHNVHDRTTQVRLDFQLPPLEGDSSFLAYGRIYVHFGHDLFDRWLSEGANGDGIQIVGDSIIQIVESSAMMSDILMGPDESGIFAVVASILPEFQCQEKKTFRCDVTQLSDDIDGGISLDILVGAPPCPVVAIEKTHGTLQGHFEEVSITTEGSLFEMGGFDFLIAYDASALTFTEAQPGDLLDTCDWEYFTYRYGANGNCGDACPSGLLRLIALAETNNGPYHPSCYGPPDCDPHELARMTFMVSNNRVYNGQYIPIEFFWGDCGDNVLSSIDGKTLYIDRAIYDFEGNVIWDEEDDVQYPEDSRIPFVGAADYCLNPDPDKPSAIRCPEFVNGGIDIIPDTAIDARGDINCNGLANEIADAVMFTNYFIMGLPAFEGHEEASIAASDVNADGIALSVADLVYLIRVITGDAAPYPKPVPYAAEASVNALVNHSAVGVSATSSTDIGAGYFTFEYSGLEIGEPYPINGASAMSLKYGNENGILKVLVYSMEKGISIPAGVENIFVIPIAGNGSIRLTDVQLSDYQGNLLAVKNEVQPVLPKSFALHQNYPNPFNAGTVIAYELPVASDVKMEIINVLGQTVATVLNGQQTAGVHTARWAGTDDNGAPVASGIYVYRMTAGAFQTERKLVLLK